MWRIVCKIALLVSLLLTTFSGVAAQTGVEQLKVEVISTRSHDPSAYTQGLVLHEGVFYESTGRHGASSLRRVNPQTGEVLLAVNINEQFFAEGLALVNGDTLIQLTWQEGVAFIFDRETLIQIGSFFYTGEGWGLCYDGEYLYMSDGSAALYKRDPQFFRVLEVIPVTLEGQPVPKLNELECVGASIYANVYQTDQIMRIDTVSGAVTGVINASGLLSEEDKAQIAATGFDPTSNAVLNGIAYDPAADVFYITGKMWHKLFEVRFVPIP